MMAVAYTDLPNGIIILLACILATPFVISSAGGLQQAQSVLPAGHFKVFNESFGTHPGSRLSDIFFQP